MKYEIYKQKYFLSLSGGKDSLYLFYYLLQNNYQLDGVVFFKLDTDYPFIESVINYVKNICNKIFIPFYIIEPDKSWEELYNKRYYPNKVRRWCNGEYKLSCRRIFEKFNLEQGIKPVYYIGYCYNEIKRAEKHKTPYEIYPLVDNRIYENDILLWAKKQKIFNNYYLTNKRCGCMGCPLTNMLNWAYLLKYYPDKYFYYINKMLYSEVNGFPPFSNIRVKDFDKKIKEKHLFKLEQEEAKEELLLNIDTKTEKFL